jgi:predicted RNA-binding Zn-ribbon protein involved in translation (DUF1610 family)
MHTKGRRINEQQVLAIRQQAREGVVINEIAKRFGLKIRATRRILNGTAWSSIHDPAGAGPVKYATTTKVRKSQKAVRPTCPDCGGFIEADSNAHQGTFLQCESCSRTWHATVTPHERRMAVAISVATHFPLTTPVIFGQ